MSLHPRSFRAVVLAGLVMALAGPVYGEKEPGPIEHLKGQGFEITDRFQAPGGLIGYVGRLDGKPLAAYLTPDGEHMVVGPMLDANGRNLTRPRLPGRSGETASEDAWSRLEQADWFGDGADDADTVIYTFTDPNCPYCHRFREAAAPWVDAGRVQIRHIMVGILKRDSPEKAATILGSDDPAAALLRNQNRFDEGGIAVDEEKVSAARERVQQNNRLMREMGLRATPVIYYRNEDGDVARRQGMPRPSQLPAIMGSPKPDS
jgi:thiol:disulfide interchange protein DsbG